MNVVVCVKQIPDPAEPGQLDPETKTLKRDTDAVPGESPDWRLSVKRGRDGKDLREEEGSHG